jgi:two-component system nitrate/nitrite response regulator NarL
VTTTAVAVHHDAGPSDGRAERAGVLIITPIRLYSDGIAHFLRASPAVDVLGTAAQGMTTIELAVRLGPDVILLDMALEDSRETSRALRAALPRTAIVALAVPESAGYVLGCAEAGISGYVPREGSLEELLTAVIRAANGEAVCSPPIVGSLFRRVAALAAMEPPVPVVPAPPVPALTARQAEIVALIDDGLSNKQIARTLCIELPTVKNHVHAILEKLGARTRGEAAATARRLAAAGR